MGNSPVQATRALTGRAWRTSTRCFASWVNDVPGGISGANKAGRMEIKGSQAGERFIFI